MTATFATIDELIRPERHLFLSPHYDDIALSCGGTAATLSRHGRRPEIALIFGDRPDPSQPLTAFARQLHDEWKLSAEEVIGARRREEAAATAAMGADERVLPFHDAIYRGERYLNDEQLFGPPHADETDLGARIAAAAGLGGEPDAGGSVRVYAPLAVGQHIDHQHAFNAGSALAARGWDVWFYEDLPYSLFPGRKDGRIAALGAAIEPGPAVDISETWETKIDAILAYPSQLTVIFRVYVDVGTSRAQIDGAMSAYARNAGDGVRAEQFWRIRP